MIARWYLITVMIFQLFTLHQTSPMTTTFINTVQAFGFCYQQYIDQAIDSASNRFPFDGSDSCGGFLRKSALSLTRLNLNHALAGVTKLLRRNGINASMTIRNGGRKGSEWIQIVINVPLPSPRSSMPSDMEKLVFHIQEEFPTIVAFFATTMFDNSRGGYALDLLPILETVKDFRQQISILTCAQSQHDEHRFARRTDCGMDQINSKDDCLSLFGTDLDDGVYFHITVESAVVDVSDLNQDILEQLVIMGLSAILNINRCFSDLSDTSEFYASNIHDIRGRT